MFRSLLTPTHRGHGRAAYVLVVVEPTPPKPGAARRMCFDNRLSTRAPIAIRSIEHMLPSANVYNLTVSNLQTYVAEDAIVHNVKP